MAPTSKRLVGLASIRIGDAKDYGQPTSGSLSTIAYIIPDSANLIIEPTEATQLFVEENDDPDIEVLTAGLKSVEFATRDMGNDAMIWAFGGTASTSTIWKSASSAPTTKEVAIELISKSYGGVQLKLEIARASLKAGATLRFAKINSGELAFTCTVLTPTNGTTVPIKRTFI